MRLVAKLLFCFLLFNCLVSVKGQTSMSSTNDPVSINYVSTISGSTTSNLQGSLMGGTALYIYGVGFDSTFENNIIYVGTTICSTNAGGVTQTRIVCYTGAYTSGPTSNLPITVQVLGKQPYTCSSSSCLFSYVSTQTPSLLWISPRASAGNEWINFYGFHKIVYDGEGRTPPNVLGLFIGEERCSTFDVLQQPLYIDKSEYITCSVSPIQEGGYYNVKQWLTPGIAKQNDRLKISSIFNISNTFSFIVSPAILQLSYQSSGSKGTELTIMGTGFSTDPSKISVTVAGVPCTIRQSTADTITCRVAQNFDGNTFGLLETNTTGTQIDGYISGTGFQFHRYSTEEMSPRTIQRFRSLISVPNEQLYEIESDPQDTPPVIGQVGDGGGFSGFWSTAQYMRGYFIAPKTGNYIFRGLAKDMMQLYLSTVKGSRQGINYSNPILKSTNYQQSMSRYNQFTVNYPSLTSPPIFMQAGGAYYMEGYHLTNIQGGFWKASVEVPNTDETALNTLYEVQRIDMTQTVVPEIIEFLVKGVNNGTIFYKIRIVDKNLNVIYNVNRTINHNATAQEFKNMLTAFSPYADFDITVTRTAFDYNDVDVTVSNEPAYSYKYSVSFRYFRNIDYSSLETTQYKFQYDFTNCSNTVNTSTTPTITWTKIQEHSPYIQGTFTITLGDVLLTFRNSSGIITNNIMYAQNQNTFTDIFRQALGKDIQVENIGYRYVEGVSWYVSFIGMQGDLPEMVTDSSLLTGGAPGTHPIAKVVTLRNGSYNLLVEPITTEFMGTASSSPAVIVKVNNAISQCHYDCSFNFIDQMTPILESATLTNNILTLNVTTQSSEIPYVVEFAGQPCEYISGNNQQYTCSLPINSDNSPIIEAGDHLPIILVPSQGYADTSKVTLIVWSLEITALDIIQGPTTGGTTITMTGKGFPTSIDKIFTLKQCNTDVEIVSVSSTEIVFVSAPCATQGSSKVQISFNGRTADADFTYQALTGQYPQITAINPKNYSPVLKGFMNISGSGFGSDKSKLTAWLNNGTNVYQLNVIEASDTLLKVRIPGGLPGNFNVVVQKEGSGYADVNPVGANAFTYGIWIDSISPATGSMNGGTIITISGKNFSPVLAENQVYVGNAINWNCIMLTATTDTITCRTPPMNQNYTLEQPVVVVGRAMEESECSGTCTFTYDNTTQPTVQNSNPPSAYTSGSQITFSGTGLVNNGVKPLVYIGNTLATINDAQTTNTSVTFTFPSIVNGTYLINVYVDGIGYAYPSFIVDNALSVTSSTQNGSWVGGSIFLNGNGLVDVDNVYLTVTVTSTSTNPFNYTIRSDNTPDKFGIDFLGCSAGKIITVTYKFRNTTYTGNYNCVAGSITTNLTLNGALSRSYNVASQDLIFTKNTNINSVPSSVYAFPIDPITGKRFGDYIQLPFTASSAQNFTVDAKTLTTGKYAFKITFSNGIAYVPYVLQITSATSPTLAANVNSGYMGGAKITINGNALSKFSKLTVAGIPANIIQSESDTSTLVYSLPPLITALSQSTYGLTEVQVLTGTLYADTLSKAQLAFDELMSTVYSSPSASCYVGWDFGPSQQASITSIRYFPNPIWRSAITYISGAKITASNDGSNWDVLETIGSTVHTGWNFWKPDSPLTNTYRYVRFQHNSTSLCGLAEFQVSGYLYAGSIASIASNTRDVVFSDGTNNVSFTGAVTYMDSITPKVTNIQPKFASPVGGDNIIISGNGFGNQNNNVNVLVDGIPCTVTSVIDTSIVCTTGARPTMPTSHSFVVQINSNTASINCDQFMYAYRWSDELTWGGDLPPTDGDTVYVPVGMVLLVDTSTPALYSIFVEGSIIFSDEVDMTIDTHFLIVEHGLFQAGTETSPYEKKLTFVLHGDYYDKQLPGFGNKVIGCHACTFDMHGARRDRTWTELSQTADIAATTIKLMEEVDWQVGEVIVIASTSFEHTEAEERTITNVSADKKTLTLDKKLRYRHISVVQTHGSDSITMRAEVGLLTRNIKIMGDSTSKGKLYGAHVMMHGLASHGLVGRIQYAEFTHCGQPAIVGRYCIHFHMNGDVSDSYVKGNAVHHSFARVLTLHAVYRLTVEYNVGYWVQGHNIFLEDGIEEHNVIQYNLMISSLSVFNMLQTDISVASYWITNPLNTVRYNHAAGSDFYGLWYQIKPNPDGASATSDICPTGLPLGECHDNVAHSNTRFGLRIFQLWSSQNPCMKIRNDGALDPWAKNPSIQNQFYNMVLWRNAEDGLLAEQIGNTIFRNFTIADSGRAGIQFYRTNFTKEPVIADNFVVIGQSDYNGMPDYNFTTPTGPTSGLITSRTDGSMYNNIRFYNFPPLSTVISVGSKNEQMTLRANEGKSYFFSNLSFTNINGNYLYYIFTRRYILYDLDGTLSRDVFDGVSRTGPVAITPYYGHNYIPGVCTNATNQTLWNTSLICNKDINVNNLMFSAGQPTSMFQGGKIFAYRLSDDFENLSATLDSGVGKSEVYKTDAEQKETWSFPFVSGYTYNIWWNTGIDWTSMAMTPSFYHNSTQDAFVIRFNYTTERELFDIGHIIAGSLQLPLSTPKSDKLNYSDCSFGDYYHDPTNRFLFVCVSGKGKATYDLLNLNGIACRYLCPKPGGGFTKQKFVRLWSNVTQWPGEVLPQAGDNITVNGNWTVLMDVDVIGLNNITIDGDIYLTDANRQLSANFIWIRYGSLNAGNSSVPFQYNFTITLNGEKSAKTYTVDEGLSVNKYIVVTGALNLYGKVPSTVYTKLTAVANAGSTSITVGSTGDWAVGNTIGISPSFAKYNQYEQVTITAINGNTVTFTPALNFTHYGDNSMWSNSFGTMDMRATVGVLDRNIRILKGSDQNGWGYGVLIYAWNDGLFINTGSGIIQGVQFSEGGQYDTFNSAFGIINTGAGNVKTKVTGSSFDHCKDYCMYFSNANNVTIDNNFFFLGRKFMVYAQNVYMYSFTNNVLIGALKRPIMIGASVKDDVACYSQYTALNWDTDQNLVSNNLCQGSSGTGFEFPHTPCNQLGKGMGFINNVAGSSDIGFLLSGPMACAGGERLRAYSNRIGVITNPNARTFVWDNLIFADNQRSMSLRFGGNDDNTNNSMIWKNSYITAVSRPNCSYCYGPNATSCTNTRAMRLLASSRNTETLPKIFGQDFEVICKAQLFDSQAWIYNVVFENFNSNYGGALAGKCSNNRLFEAHPIDDSNIGNHHLYNTTCVNCDSNAYGHFDPPIASHFGWLGGCGNMPCTGRNNYLIHDHDGSFLGFQGIIIPNNSDIGQNTQGCTFNSVTNGYICNRTDFARLKYTSIAPDFQSRIMWPVSLSYEGGNWTSKTNGWRQWEWDGDEPLNKRMGRFLSIVQLYKIYNMSFEAQPPIDMLFSFSLPSLSGDNSQWVGIKIYYPIPNAIQVTHSKNGSKTRAILATDNDNITNYVSECGTNKYFYKNNTIHFIVTADASCTVRVSLTSSVQVTARLSLDINKFYENNGITTFIDLMSAFLGVTTDRLKIVGVYSGSTIVDFVISPTLIPTNQSSSHVPNSPEVIADLRLLAGKMNNATAADFPSLPSFLGATSTVNIMNANGQTVTEETTTQTNTKFIIIGVVVGVAAAVLLGVSIYLIIRKLRTRNPIMPDDSNLGEQVSKDVIRQDNKSEFELKNMDFSAYPENIAQQVHPE